MPIARLSFPEGEPIPPDPAKSLESVARLVVARFAEVVFLDPDEYEITPAAWKRNNYTHHLTVHDNDTGTYRMIPVHEDSVTLDSHHLERGYAQGGRIQKIPQDGKLVVVASPAVDMQAFQVYEVIAHLP